LNLCNKKSTKPKYFSESFKIKKTRKTQKVEVLMQGNDFIFAIKVTKQIIVALPRNSRKEVFDSFTEGKEKKKNTKSINL
jgi:hypothetical protein